MIIFRICKFLPTKLLFFKNKAASPIYLFEDSGILVGGSHIMMWFPSVILSLWMVLKMRNSIWWFCLEDNTEQSESNPGRSLGVTMIYKTAVWKTVPCWRAEGAQQCGTVFQTDLFSLVINPETFFRVTLALLGIVFQTKSPDTITHLQDHP